MAQRVKSNAAAADAIGNREAFTNRNNTFFANVKINGDYVVYSYGYHWPLAVYNAEQGVWIVNDEFASATTTKHAAIVRRGIPNAYILTDKAGINRAEIGIFNKEDATGIYHRDFSVRDKTALHLNCFWDLPESVKLGAKGKKASDLFGFDYGNNNLVNAIVGQFVNKPIKRVNNHFFRLAA